MKNILILLILVLASSASECQRNKLDSLLENINNDQLVGVCHYFWLLEMHSPAGSEIINIGKSSTDRLFNLLTDSSRGIIAHYILSSIWLDTIKSTNSGTNYESKHIIDYTIGDLSFFWDKKMQTEPGDLLRNKEQWFRYLSAKSCR